jgi:hypothetical protein
MEVYYYYGECRDYQKLFDFLYEEFDGDPLIYETIERDELLKLDIEYIENFKEIKTKLEEDFYCLELKEYFPDNIDRDEDGSDFDVFFNSDDI